MIILYPHEGFLVLDDIKNSIGELLVYDFIISPVYVVESGPCVSHVAKRPYGFIGVSVVVAVFFIFREPYSSQFIFRIFGRDFYFVFFVNNVFIGIPASVGYPCSAGNPHDRIQCRNSAAYRSNMLDFTLFIRVNIGLSIGCND